MGSGRSAGRNVPPICISTERDSKSAQESLSFTSVAGARYALLLIQLSGLAACESGPDGNPVRAAFAQRPAARAMQPSIMFRLPAAAGAPVRLYRLPRFEEVSRRFDTPGLTTAQVVAFSDDDDQVYVLSTRGTLLADRKSTRLNSSH